MASKSNPDKKHSFTGIPVVDLYKMGKKVLSNGSSNGGRKAESAPVPADKHKEDAKKLRTKSRKEIEKATGESSKKKSSKKKPSKKKNYD